MERLLGEETAVRRRRKRRAGLRSKLSTASNISLPQSSALLTSFPPSFSPSSFPSLPSRRLALSPSRPSLQKAPLTPSSTHPILILAPCHLPPPPAPSSPSPSEQDEVQPPPKEIEFTQAELMDGLRRRLEEFVQALKREEEGYTVVRLLLLSLFSFLLGARARARLTPFFLSLPPPLLASPLTTTNAKQHRSS